jgi:hypothetical protein
MTDAHIFHPELLPMLDCPKWQQCSAPLCPLDADMEERGKAIDGSKDGGVKERKCTLGKAKRMRLGASLETLGLFPRELAGLRGWQAKSETEKAVQRARNRRNLGLP